MTIRLKCRRNYSKLYDYLVETPNLSTVVGRQSATLYEE